MMMDSFGHSFLFEFDEVLLVLWEPVDITSGLVIWLTARAIRKRDPYMYPRGRTRLQPIALIIVSVIMGVASMQMIVQSLESVIRQNVDPHVNLIS
ncbi:unnamed protein product, partial [Anisakis simplex]|uniref:Proton_antipo_M domain-containing protein n=1 Tax=Anisakis simplex TaxID=6269 RepID=A0A0M3JQ51_ANISI